MLRLNSEVQKDLRTLLAGGDPSTIAERVRAMPPDQIATLLAALHPADGADVLGELRPEQQREVFANLEHESAAEVLAYVDTGQQARIVADMPAAELSDILGEMEPDDAADVLSELPAAQAQATLSQMKDGGEVQALLDYGEDCAGRLMTPNAVTLRAEASVGQALQALRKLAPDEGLAYYLYVTDTGGRLVGVVSLRQLVTAQVDAPLSSIMATHVISVPASADKEKAAQVLSHYGLMALPMVDEDGRLVGVITADDVIDVIQQEATEDIYHLAGLDGSERVDESVLTSSRRRLTWLLINLPTALLASWVVSRFEGTVQKVAVLATFMPIIAGMGGNAGIQTLTLIVRSIALGEMTVRDSAGALARETLVGLINGLSFGLVVGLVGLLWKGMPMLGLVAGLAMLANMLAAAVAGTIVPLLLRRFGADPALASGVIVTTFTDVTGYGCFLGLATVLLRFF